MLQIALCTLAGFIIGIIFSLIKMPVPVPHEFAGIAGLIGMFLGKMVFQIVLPHIGR